MMAARHLTVRSLRADQLSLRRIAAVTGTSPATVHRDVRALLAAGFVGPTRVVGVDGKRYPAQTGGC